MGVPAFFRWLMQKYPKCIIEHVEEEEPDGGGSVDITRPNPNGVEWDNLYLDLNGIVHNATHGEDLRERPSGLQEQMQNIMRYIDRLVRIVRPRKLLYIAVDGVAPRAKMNQQRSRRFRAVQEMEERAEVEESVRNKLASMGSKVPPKKKPSWDHNVITPGSPFMTTLSEALRWYVADRLTHEPGWREFQIIISDARVPGEGEHKIMNFIRDQRCKPGHDPNTRHILHGLDADLIMLGLATHEAHFTILREQVFAARGQDKVADSGYFDKPLQLLNVSVLREYLQAEFAPLAREGVLTGTSADGTQFAYDFERVVDDFVFLCFFVGNDFLPHLPALNIREGALDMLISMSVSSATPRFRTCRCPCFF